MMKTSQQGLDLLIAREDLRTAAYQDTKGIWTIGVGHTGPDIVEGLIWTDAHCREVFAQDIGRFEQAVNDCCADVGLSQNEFDALVSFSFNCGTNALAHGGNGGGPSSILQALKNGDHAAAAAAFNNWMADAAVRTRRAGEREQFKGTAFQARFP